MAIPDFLKKTVLVLDTETAELGDHIVEVGFSVFKNAQLVHEFGMLVCPIVPIEKGAENVHKISMLDVEDEPTFKDIAMWCYNILNSADYHCAYNYEYDRKVFEKEFARYGLSFPIKPMIDPMVFFKKWNKFNKGKKLINAAEKYGIEYIGAHRAKNDSTATGRLLFKMAATRVDFPKTPDKLITLQRKLVQAQFEDLDAYFKKIGKVLNDFHPPDYTVYEVQV